MPIDSSSLVVAYSACSAATDEAGGRYIVITSQDSCDGASGNMEAGLGEFAGIAITSARGYSHITHRQRAASLLESVLAVRYCGEMADTSPRSIHTVSVSALQEVMDGAVSIGTEYITAYYYSSATAGAAYWCEIARACSEDSSRYLFSDIVIIL